MSIGKPYAGQKLILFTDHIAGLYFCSIFDNVLFFLDRNISQREEAGMMETIDSVISRRWRIPTISDIQICGQFPFAQRLLSIRNEAANQRIREIIESLKEERKRG